MGKHTYLLNLETIRALGNRDINHSGVLLNAYRILFTQIYLAKSDTRDMYGSNRRNRLERIFADSTLDEIASLWRDLNKNQSPLNLKDLRILAAYWDPDNKRTKKDFDKKVDKYLVEIDRMLWRNQIFEQYLSYLQDEDKRRNL